MGLLAIRASPKSPRKEDRGEIGDLGQAGKDRECYPGREKERVKSGHLRLHEPLHPETTDRSRQIGWISAWAYQPKVPFSPHGPCGDVA